MEPASFGYRPYILPNPCNGYRNLVESIEPYRHSFPRILELQGPIVYPENLGGRHSTDGFDILIDAPASRTASSKRPTWAEWPLQQKQCWTSAPGTGRRPCAVLLRPLVGGEERLWFGAVFSAPTIAATARIETGMTAEMYWQPDFATYRVALVEYEHQHVYGCRSIHVASTPLELLKEVAPLLLGYAETVVSTFWEHFRIYDDVMCQLFDPDGECPLFKDCYDQDEIVPLLRHMAKTHERELADCAGDTSILGSWYQELIVLSEVADPYDNFIRIRVPIEADVVTFAKRLVEHEAKRFDARLVLVQNDEERFQAVRHSKNARELPRSEAIELGQLAVLAYAPNWQWESQPTIRAFGRWVDRFNADNEG